MAAPTEYYVDGSLGSDTGDGTVGTPWGRATGSVIQYALNTGITRDSTDGDRINVKAGTDDTLAATLSFTTYGTPTFSAPLIIQGYTTAAGDLGIGGIDGAATYGVGDGATSDQIKIVDMHIHNSGTAQLINFDNDCLLLRCEVNKSTHSTPVHMDIGGTIRNCHFHDMKMVDSGNSHVSDCYFKNDGTTDFVTAVNMVLGPGSVRNCKFSLDGASAAIQIQSSQNTVQGNSILSSSGTGTGIVATASGGGSAILNNIIEGFSGAGGDGIDFENVANNGNEYAGNAFYNNTNHEVNKVAGEWMYEGSNENDIDETDLPSSAFSKSGADTFANSNTYFKPLDVGNVYNGAYPVGSNFDKGAVQHDDPAGGGLIPVFRSNSLITR